MLTKCFQLDANNVNFVYYGKTQIQKWNSQLPLFRGKKSILLVFSHWRVEKFHREFSEISHPITRLLMW